METFWPPLWPGARPAGLNAIGRKLLEVTDVDQIIIQGATRTTGRNPGRIPKSSSSHTVKLVLTADDIRQPINVAHVLREHGMSLRRAHDVLTKLAQRQAVAVELDADDAGQLFSQLSDVGVNADPIQIPDIDVKRRRVGEGAGGTPALRGDALLTKS
jgi:hypothetical protein